MYFHTAHGKSFPCGTCEEMIIVPDRLAPKYEEMFYRRVDEGCNAHGWHY